MDYQKGKIYKIESHLGDKIYIGSTTKQYLSQRMTAHRNGYKRWKAEKCTRVTSYDLFDTYGIENCQIVLIEIFPCNSKDELHSREAFYIRSMTCVNKYIPDRTDEEYREGRKDIKKEYDTKYRELNSERKKAWDKHYRETHTDIIKERKMNYREENKEKIKETKRQYYIAHKDLIQENNAKMMTCECGASCKKNGMSKHLRTTKHITYIDSKTV